MCNGLTGFKPTQRRFTYEGGLPARKHSFDYQQQTFAACMGPLAHSTRDCAEFFKLMCRKDAHLRDPFMAPTTFNEQMYDSVLREPRKVRVGIVNEISKLPTSKSVKRAMQIARRALEEQGFEVVDCPFDADKYYGEATKYLISMIAQGLPGLSKDMEDNGEKMTLDVMANLLLLNGSSMFQSFVRCIQSLAGMRRALPALENVRVRDPTEYEQLMKDRYEFSYRFSKMWQENKLDAMVTPSYFHCAFKAADAMDIGLTFDYMWLWNVLEYPSGNLPITTVQANELDSFSNDGFSDGWTRLMQNTEQGSEGMPISVQVVGHSFEDEKVLAVMQAIDDKVKFRMEAKRVDLK